MGILKICVTSAIRLLCLVLPLTPLAMFIIVWLLSGCQKSQALQAPLTSLPQRQVCCQPKEAQIPPQEAEVGTDQLEDLQPQRDLSRTSTVYSESGDMSLFEGWFSQPKTTDVLSGGEPDETRTSLDWLDLPQGRIVKAEPVHPDWKSIELAWEFLVRKEYGSLYTPPLGSPQWLNYVASGKSWESYRRHPEAQDGMAISPINLTPRRLEDMIARQSIHMSVASLAALDKTGNDVENILWASVMVSGVARFSGAPDEAHERLWRTSASISRLEPAVYRIWIHGHVTPYIVRVPDFDYGATSKKKISLALDLSHKRR